MSDDARTHKGLTLCTDSFAVKEVILLMNILMIRYNLKCSMHMFAGLPKIYISTSSMLHLREIVKPYMFSFSNYKFYRL